MEVYVEKRGTMDKGNKEEKLQRGDFNDGIRMKD